MCIGYLPRPVVRRVAELKAQEKYQKQQYVAEMPHDRVLINLK